MPETARNRILVVENEPIVAIDLEQRLGKMGYEVPPVVATGKDAIAAAEREVPDLVLMDINLRGDMDGVEAAEQIRRTHHIPIVYLTAYLNDRTLERAKITEPFGYLIKPFEARELQTTIEIALYKHQSEEALRQAHEQLERRVEERTAELSATNESLQREIEERGHREARHLALQRVREEVWHMQTATDIQKVLSAIWEGLDALKVPFDHCGINVVEIDASRVVVRVHDRAHDGPWRALAPETDRAASAVLRISRAGVSEYRPDLEQADPYDERDDLKSAYGPQRCALDAPFAGGTLAAYSSQANAFSEADIAVVEAFADTLSEGFRRLRDIQQLGSERERLAVTLRSIGEGVVATDADGRILLLNRASEALTGWSQAEAKGRQLEEVFRLIDEKTRAMCENPVSRVIERGASVDRIQPTVLVARDGSEHLVSTSSAPIRDDEGKTVGVVLASRDMGEQRKVEQEQLKSAKLESLGVLAGGIAHDFNNILTTVIGYLSLAKMDIDPDTELFENLTEVEQASKRATELTHQLLAFSKGGAPVKTTASIAELIRDSATFATRGSNVRCEFDVATDLWRAEIDAGQISQAIQNLVLNADQAMASGGAVNIAASNCEITADTGLPLSPGRYIRIGVSDEGVGISPEHLTRIFDPYFTTKPDGSGLGLATAYAIIQNHEGHITVESEEAKGAEFLLYLPACDTVLAPVEEPNDVVVTGSGRVLVLDDEAPIRRLAGNLLSRLGYEVEFAREGRQAVDRYREAHNGNRAFNAVIMDLTIPGGMGGRDAVRELLRIDPAARVIVSSGYSEDPVMADYREFGFAGVVSKPYDIQELSQVLGLVLPR